MPKARTFIDDRNTIEVDVVVGPSSTGLCKVAYGSRILVRHKDRLEPLNEEARRMLGK